MNTVTKLQKMREEFDIKFTGYKIEENEKGFLIKVEREGATDLSVWTSQGILRYYKTVEKAKQAAEKITGIKTKISIQCKK